jgi:ribosomal protein S18 acetylase RimI-like enzyme
VPFHGRRALAIWLWPTLRQHYRELAGPHFWHVHAVAVAPGAQGRGVGSELMAAVLQGLSRLRAARPAPVLLSTQRAIDVRLYARFGFELVAERDMGQGAREPGCHSWFMRLRA